MTTATATVGAKTTAARPGNRVSFALLDALTITWRNLIAITRIPEALFFSTLQPVMFVLLFRYVFGGAIRIPGVPYVNFMMAGIFVQTMAFGSMGTAIGLSEDLSKGLIERFRSLPMARSAVLAGRTTADLVRNVFVLLLMTGVGYAVGFRIGNGLPEFLLAGLVLLLFSYALAWVFALVGLSAPNPETAQVMAFPILFPLTFASGAFVPVATMPGPLRAFARNQPVTAVVDAARALMVKVPASIPHPSTTTLTLKALAWIGGILVVFVFLAVRKYRKVA
ncbi:MAG TPA: ABC transporter permease [Acidimicrobiales bacterium]|nr:ABC transporter permease [Acidimicrobiales bacterium]